MSDVDETKDTVVETKDTITDIYSVFFDAGFNSQEYPKSFGFNHAKAKEAYERGINHRRNAS